MLLDPEKESPGRVYSTMIRAITPRPIAWVSSVSAGGVSNLAPFSYFNGVSTTPAALMFSAVNKPDGTKKDTVRNIESTKQFVVNIVPHAVAEKMAITASDFDYEVSEFEKAGLTERPSHRVNVPSVVQSPIQFECELMQIVNIGKGPLAANVIFGRILLMSIDESVLKDDKIDPDLVDSIGRMGGRGYCRTTERFTLG